MDGKHLCEVLCGKSPKPEMNCALLAIFPCLFHFLLLLRDLKI